MAESGLQVGRSISSSDCSAYLAFTAAWHRQQNFSMGPDVKLGSQANPDDATATLQLACKRQKSTQHSQYIFSL